MPSSKPDEEHEELETRRENEQQVLSRLRSQVMALTYRHKALVNQLAQQKADYDAKLESFATELARIKAELGIF